jgi:hypothetical protein
MWKLYVLTKCEFLQADNSSQQQHISTCIFSEVPVPRRLYVVAAFSVAFAMTVTGCGGGSSSPAPAPAPTTSSPPPAPAPAPAPSQPVPVPVVAPVVVNVPAGRPVAGVDINVPSPASSPVPNAEVLGVTPIGAGGSASNVGATISRGATMRVLLFGQGLDGSMTVTIDGPQDIIVTNIRSITSTNNKPGVSFDATVSASAALGARTVFLRTSNDDITAFTGGLEVVP